jgi:hypothetical protein
VSITKATTLPRRDAHLFDGHGAPSTVTNQRGEGFDHRARDAERGEALGEEAAAGALFEAVAEGGDGVVEGVRVEAVGVGLGDDGEGVGATSMGAGMMVAAWW